MTRLEQEVDERWLLLAEQLLDEEQVIRLEEIDKHLWIGQVAAHEVELQVGAHKLKAFTCECAHFQKHRLCEHVVAGALYLRNLLEERRRAAERSQPVKNAKEDPSGKLTIPHILANAPPQELQDFVRDYARTNRNFAIALKTRFAGAIPSKNKREKYLQLLDAAIQASRNKNDKLSARGVQKILKVIRDLNAQAKKAIAEEHASKAVSILTSVLEKAGPLIRKSIGNPDALELGLLDAIDGLKLLTQQPLAPPLQEEIWHFSLREAGKSTLQHTRLLPAYIQLLPRLIREKEQRATLLQFLAQQSPKTQANSPERAALLTQQLYLLDQEDTPDGLFPFLFDHLSEAPFIPRAAQYLHEKGHPEKAALLVEKALETMTDPKAIVQLKQLSLSIALQKGEQEKALPLARELFLETKDLPFLDTLKQAAGNQWEVLRPLLLEDLEQQPFSRPKRDAIAYLLASENLPEQLFDYIEKTQSLELLQQYDKLLLATDPKRLERLYEHMLYQYLKNHLGRKPSAKVRDILLHLQRQGFEDILAHLLTVFRHAFPDRPSLMEELASFEDRTS